MHSETLIRISAAIGAVFGAIGVGLGAWATHAAEPAAQARLQTAALYLLLHALALLAWRAHGRGGIAAMVAGGFVLGTVLFAGSLIGAALWQWPTRLAPFGGSLLILSWLLAAVELLRARR